MTYKQIETSREIRLWVTQILTPVAIGVGIAMTNPEIRGKISEKFDNAKNKFKNRKFIVIK